MIKENEIRVGNWFVGYDKPFKWEMKHFCLIADRIEVDEIIKEPIPLEPEILERCGFERLDAIECFTIPTETGEIVISFSYILQSTDTVTKITYLHQLQNLYFALTGEELEYTP